MVTWLAKFPRIRLEPVIIRVDDNLITVVMQTVNNTALIYAIIQGHVKFARMLLERGAAINARGSRGMTALHHAVDNGETQAVRLLLEYGADVNARDRDGDTPSQLGLKLLSAYGAESLMG